MFRVKGKKMSWWKKTNLSFKSFYVCGGENLVIGKSPKLHFVNNITKPHNEYAVNNKAWET